MGPTTRHNTTKPWNHNLDHANPDECLCTDYEDGTWMKKVCVKYKTTLERLQLWIKAHESVYNGEWKNEDFSKTFKVKNELGNLTVRFHTTRGIITVQGSQYDSYCDDKFSELKRMVDQLEGEVTQDPSYPISLSFWPSYPVSLFFIYIPYPIKFCHTPHILTFRGIYFLINVFSRQFF